MSDLAGGLDIRLETASDGHVCRIDSTRPVHAAAVFKGRTLEQTASRLPLLYSVCARAQSAAAAAALEQASGLTPSPGARLGREAAILTETIREHLWRILLDWPLLLDEPPARATMATVLGLTNRILKQLDPVEDLFQPGSGRQTGIPPLARQLATELGACLDRHVFGMPALAWLERMTDVAVLIDWSRAGETGAARLLRSVLDAGEAALGRADVAELPEIADAALIARLSSESASEFIARPTWEGQPRETSPFTRALDTRLVRALVDAHGRGLLARLAAQLHEVASALSALLGAPVPDQAPPSLGPRAGVGAGVGLGRARAARGLLVHYVRLEQGRVDEYRILAPTEWNFHPLGVVAQGLAALPPGSEPERRRRAELLITAIDPCVAFKLSLA
ncbi:MAG: Ni,Fe-hydrogenase I large subunit [Sphingobacteriia bacterium]|nr:Ni,Fe-hydrogenase I large subunit [Sphingobacteriia bacterium]NCC38586.1 Ni,Fe-hydrogenase I large subunit [Gammaproteobacteria bacterium]